MERRDERALARARRRRRGTDDRLPAPASTRRCRGARPGRAVGARRGALPVQERGVDRRAADRTRLRDGPHLRLGPDRPRGLAREPPPRARRRGIRGRLPGRLPHEHPLPPRGAVRVPLRDRDPALPAGSTARLAHPASAGYFRRRLRRSRPHTPTRRIADGVPRRRRPRNGRRAGAELPAARRDPDRGFLAGAPWWTLCGRPLGQPAPVEPEARAREDAARRAGLVLSLRAARGARRAIRTARTSPTTSSRSCTPTSGATGTARWRRSGPRRRGSSA